MLRLRKLDDDELSFMRSLFFNKEMAAGFSDQQKRVVQDDGPTIYFHYLPMELQNYYIDNVIESIRTGKYSALESPTGTGKTLCLLSAALSYLHYHYNVLKST
jgi:superfamily II DNA or RNA helicase